MSSPSFNSSALKSSIALLLLALGWLGARASSVPPGFTETVVPGPFAGLWGKPVGATFDATGRLFVWERVGRIWVKGPTETNFTLLLSIEEEEGDEGLLGFAIDPAFPVNGYIYLLYVVDRHHLLHFGTTNYNPNVTQDDEATIARLTRYTCVASNDFKSVNPASRLILLGETKTNGIPVCGITHTIGSVVFGQDGTLLLATGDTASFSEVDLGGTVGGSYAPQAVADGIIRPKENVGAYRAQLVDGLNGKLLRLDPATGNGLPSNPYYDPANPRAAKSRVWALGLRNPFRMARRPDSGSHNPADGDPGAFYIGDVGWDSKESLKVVTGPRQNFGWPLYEGLSLTPDRGAATYNTDVANLDATNAQCGGYFSFRQLLKPASTNAASQPPFNNPCNAAVKISTNIPQFLHYRAALDWEHGYALTHTPTYDSAGNGTLAEVGASGSPVAGAQFQGNCSVAGTWYSGTVFPAAYQNKYFHSEWGQQRIKLMAFDTNNRPTAVSEFAANTGPVVSIVPHPFDGSLYYVTYDGDTGTVWRLAYTGNRTPVAVLTADQHFGPGPLTVQFNGGASSDPDGQALSYLWNFGDGTANSTALNPAHVFSSPGNIRTNYLVTLTVTDSGGLPASATLNVALNDTPPTVTLTSPTNGSRYSVISNTPFTLTATVSDLESSDSQLQYQWQTVLHHNDHNHVEGISTNHVSATIVEPAGCDGINLYYYRVILTVTDPRGLATIREVRLFPDCGATDTPPTISDIANQGTALNQPTTPVAFTIGDAQAAAANLQLSAVSSDTVLVPPGNIVFGGFGSNRTVTVTPAASATGTALITVTVNDGPNDVSDSFLLTVSGSNTPPGISPLTNQTTPEGTPSAANPFTIGDANTAAGSLVLSGSAANQVLVPPGNIVFGGSGSNRTVTVTPGAGQSGSTLVTVTVSDGQLSASNSFTLTVTSLPASSKSFTNTTAIVVPDLAAALPYPSTINVSGLGGAVSNLTVTLRSLNYQWGRDLDVLLVSPGGQAMILMSDAGTEATAVNANLTFSNNAATFLNQSNSLLSGLYKPTDYPPADTFPSPAPAGPYATNFSVFTGAPANGAWSLYVVDDGTGDTGSISGGWSLTIVTQGGSSSNNPPTLSGISNQVTVVNTGTAALPFTIGDGETATSNLVLSVASSNTGLVPTNQIVLGGSGASRTVTVTPASNQLGSATITLQVSDGTLSASNSFVVTVNAAVLTVTENGASRSYGATNPVLSGSVVGLQAGDVITAGFSSGATTNSPVGAYAITFSLSDPGGKLGNYVITTNHGTLTVTNALLTITENSTNRSYGATNPVLTGSLTGLQAGDVITATFTSTAATNSPVGAYAITFSLSDPGTKLGNYLVTTNHGTLTVAGALLTVTANSTNKVYGTTRTFLKTEFAITSGTLFNGNTLTNVTLASAGTNATAAVAAYPITATNALGLGLTNYSLSYSNGTLVVTQAVLVATADNQSRAYGQLNPAFTISYAGFVNGEGTNVLDSLPFASTTATNTTAPGNYPITVSGGLDDNYSFSLIAGTLAIAPPGDITLATFEMLDPDHFRLAGTGDAGVTYQIQASSDLQTWQPLGTATADGAGTFEFVDALAGGFAVRFYRVSTP